MIDKNYCMSSYLALRFIERDDMDFFDGIHHENFQTVSNDPKILVDSVDELDGAIRANFEKVQGKSLGLFLSGGMDSGNLAAYMPAGSKAYTFRFLNGKFQEEELNRAKFYAETYNLDLQFIDVDWNLVESSIDRLMKSKGSPLHPIEPQVFAATIKAKNDGIDYIVTGECADRIFGGLSKILSKDWSPESFAKFYTFLAPEKVLKNPVDMSYAFERYRVGENSFDTLRFIREIFSLEGSSAYNNSFKLANMKCFEPYSNLKLKSPLDINRIRNGESKYLIRGLFAQKYPDFPIPEKIPMPRPVDFYFKNWNGVKRPEFREDIDLTTLTGNQKWQLYCLERFLNLFEG